MSWKLEDRIVDRLDEAISEAERFLARAIQAVERWAATNGIDRETTGGLVSATLSLLAEVGE